MEKSKKERIRETRKGKSNAKPSVSEEIRKYFMSNLLSVIWSASLLVGGLIFWMYFFQIQYFPDLSFAESGLLLPLAAITGIFLLLLIAFMFMLPYFIRWVMLESVKWVLTEKYKQKEGETGGELFWYFFSIYLTNLGFLFFNYQNNIGVINEQIARINSIYVFLYFLFINVVFYLWWMIRKGLPWIKKKLTSPNTIDQLDLESKKVKEEEEEVENQKKSSTLIAWIYSWFVSLMSLLILITLIEKIEAIEKKETYEIFLLLAGVFFIVMFANFAFAYYRDQAKRQWWIPIIPFIAVFFIFYIAKDPLIPKMVMRRFHFGNFTAERLILDKEGCKLLRCMGLKPMPIKDKNDNDLKECYLENIKILSRLGRVFVLEKKSAAKRLISTFLKIMSFPGELSKRKRKENQEKTKLRIRPRLKLIPKRKLKLVPKMNKPRFLDLCLK
jgi:hypothetical protein